MERGTVYIETSVISYLTGDDSRNLWVLGHQQITREWWNEELPKLDGFISEVVLEEIERGDTAAAAARIEATKNFPLLKIVTEVQRLADAYYQELSLPARAKADAAHLALAAWHGIDYLVTWNCAHIANARVRRLLERINANWNIQTPVICTPEELTESKE
jgi:predicted nucleic acid-binding protein